MNKNRGGKKWDTSRISKIIKKVSAERMGVEKLTMQPWRDIAIIINKKYLRKKFEENKEDEKNINKNSIENIQIKYKLYIAGIIYG